MICEPSGLLSVMEYERRDKSDFAWYYSNLCALQNTYPHQPLTANLAEDFIDCNADRIKPPDWNPIFDALRTNSSLKFLAFRSYWQPSKGGYDGSAEPRLYTLRKRAPAIKSKDVTYRMCRALQECLATTQCLECLILQGIPLRGGDVAHLAKGLLKNKTLKYLSLEFCNIGDESLQVLSCGIRKSISLTSVNFSGCGLTWRSGEILSSLIKDQATRRYGEAWQQSLRYRIPDFNNMIGLKRITLNHNTVMGDRSATFLAEALKDDLWVKALDMQQCGLTTEGAKTFLSAMEINKTLVVLDLRMNPMIDEEVLASVTEYAKKNGGSESLEFPWISTKKGQMSKHKNQRKGVRFSVTRKVTSRRCLSNVPAAKRHETSSHVKSNSRDPVCHVPWRVEARINENRGRLSNPLRHVTSFTAMQASSEACSKRGSRRPVRSATKFRKEKRVEASDSDSDDISGADVKGLYIEIEAMRRKLASEARERLKCNARINELELENRRLRNEIHLMQTSLKGQEKTERNGKRAGNRVLDDEKVLQSIEASFRQFQSFLDMLKSSGYGDFTSLLSQPAESKEPSLYPVE